MSSPSPELSCDQPMKNLPTTSNDEAATSESRRTKRQRLQSSEPSSVSLKSSRSLVHPPEFSVGPVISDTCTRRKSQRSESPESSFMDQPPLVGDAPANSDPP
ncbi:hypothetical protein Q8A67_005322 [Cirrhinus molitorella]|uniref:Uncharacterized protein n=1 Tax=Cirrhinus molitorella TaxID=172907 RepID=A0AA88Q202_9TELE|nr:hypothetical protein Q8A67_005322 [Cirrhinus molitorella]